MHKYMKVAAIALLMVVGQLIAGPVYKTGTLEVTNFVKTASMDIKLHMSDASFQRLNQVTAYNSGGGGTGVVSFAVLDLDDNVIATAIASSNLYSGCSYIGHPKYANTGDGYTNVESYVVRKVRVTTTQSITNTPTTYKFGIYAD